MNLCNCIALYDWEPETVNLKGWFHYIEQWAQDIGMSWESIGLGFSQKLMRFKSGRRKAEKLDFAKLPHIGLFGGVDEPGTYINWKISSYFFNKERGETYICFSNNLKPFTKRVLRAELIRLLPFANFKYGICYQRDFNKGPSSYAGGAIETYGNLELPQVERSQIASWMHEYNFEDGGYRTGLLRDVYPFNIFVDTHLIQKVGDTTLEAWIDADPTHGSLEKITDKHWLWSIDPDHIPAAQETLQEAGLLLCYKV